MRELRLGQGAGNRTRQPSSIREATCAAPRWMRLSIAILISFNLPRPALALIPTPTPSFSTVVQPEGTAFPVHAPLAGNQGIPEVASN